MFAAYFEHGRNVGDVDVLVDISREIGLAATETRRVLLANEYESAVRADERTARERGFTSVPTIVIDQQIYLSGAQPTGTIAAAWESAWLQRQNGALTASS